MTGPGQVAMMLGRMGAQLSSIEQTVSKLDCAINGNGKPGIIKDHHDLQELVKKHCDRDEEERIARDKLAAQDKEKREKISGRTWAVIMVLITQAVALAVLFIRTGGLK